MPKLTLLVGPPGSGKTTFAKNILTTDTSIVYINQDSQGKDGHLLNFLTALQYKKDIIVDRMNFNKEQRSKYIDPCRYAGYEIEIHVFHESTETCLNRCISRKNHETIKDPISATRAVSFFFKNYERVQDSEDAKITRYYPEGFKPNVIICDLDGTLCNIDHRKKWVNTEGKKNWPMFFAGIKNDTLNKWCADILYYLSAYTYNDIVFCSGRGSETRKMTQEWLDKIKYNEISLRYKNLFMRQTGDYRKDYIVKEILLDFEILTRYTPYLVIDDRKSVVDMWRRRGLICLQCA